MKTLTTSLFGLSLLAFTLIGCSQSESTAENPDDTSQTGQNYVTTTEPEGAVNIGAAREEVQDEEEVVLVGRIGGSEKPFIDGIAAFTVVDMKVPYCANEEGCPTPWDYCCKQHEVKDNIATVKVVGEDGKPVTEDARKLLGVKELSTVVVKGKAKKDQEGNLSILATEVFVKK